ncbi:uncharacterized protein LOC120281872 [Dioscorea cayenensis subsp. rotundata]|uniref:Uncharacterized protein LOC120281872 n=1 Tax=Dioscorea cayennensis subsp. rotundata TaxID=55577 RepID=A0AB40D2P7_DIOCR|nr:uncharacterized protein LOC120281872 [Dioscorea cayenensis subsp. rotundata]XP_039144499.1 uncharacterized protein LOC120281872 [Dioscorea cayenensis subsp. rotundata]XP_039144500.1 uncharacterized protein LOC120281872 [Dioscorea cayenensis subsp. rotundata]
MGWDNRLKMIIMGESEFKNYIKIHPHDEPYLNKQIEDHDLLEIVCGNDQATGRRAVQFGDEIGTHINDSDEYRHPSQTDSLDDMFEDTYFHVNIPLPTHNQSESTENRGESSAQSKKGKGKRKMPTEVEAIQEINNTIKETLLTKKSTQNLEFAKELIGECMKLKVYGYCGHQINKAYDWLMSDDSRAMAFLAKDESYGSIGRRTSLNQFTNKKNIFEVPFRVLEHVDMIYQ